MTTKPARSWESIEVLPSVASANGARAVERLLGGHDRAHELDERQHRHGVEEVHAEHALGLRGVGGELHDRHRGGVGGEELGVGQDLVELEEQLALGAPRPRRPPRWRRRRPRGPRRAWCRRAARRRRCGRPASSLPERAARSSDFSIFARVCSTRASSTSTTVTSTPERAQTSAIPEPMRPPPITPTRIGRDPSGCGVQAAAESGARGDDADAVAQVRRAGEHRAPGAALGGRLAGERTRVAAVVEMLREGRLRALRVDVDDVVHGELPSSLQAKQPRREHLRGKSGHQRAGWSVTPTRGNPRESATENTPPTLAARSCSRGRARLKWCGKSAPAPR